MLIKSLTICNFKNFQGKNHINMTTDPSKNRNIILIGGKNGAGKTTVVEAIKLCLFGRHFNGYGFSRNSYQKLIRSLKNKTASRKKGSEFYIQVTLEINEVFPNYSLELKREWKTNRKEMVENFSVLRDEIPLEIVPREYWEDYILSIIPPYISEFFFFDGEKVKELASGNNADIILRESIKDAIGLNIYETLFKDIEVLIKKISRRNIQHKGLEDELHEKDLEYSELQRELKKVANSIDENRSKIENLVQKKAEIEKDLRRTSGIYAIERKKNEFELNKTKEKLNDIEDKIRQICGNILPFIISSEMCIDLLTQLRKEKRLKELILGQSILKETKDKLINKIDNDLVSKDIPIAGLNRIREDVKSIFSEMLKEIQDFSKVDLLHDLSPAEADSIIFFLINTEQNLKKKLKKHLDKREKYLRKSKKLNDKLTEVPDESFVNQYIENISKIQTEINLLEIENAALGDNEPVLKTKLNTVAEKILEMEKRVVASEEEKRKIELLYLVRKIIKEYSDYSVSIGIKELEKLITRMFKKLANKDDLVKRIKIDKESFFSIMSDYNGEIINKEGISAGEKEIYALSVLWGLSRVSKRRLPIIIDAPLSKLDSSHVINITKEFFPKASDQVIILSHDREIDNSVYKSIKQNINREYTLSLLEKNKIIEGYFNKIENNVN